MTAPINASNYRPDIDGLRAVAVIAVVLFHLGVDGLQGGFVGVDVFFVISGFLITGLIVNEVERTAAFNFRHFYLRRLRRLGPALLFTMFATSLGAVLLYAPQDLQRYGASLLHAVLSLSNVLFWSQAGYFESGSATNALLHTWSLSVEEQFYMFWPIVLVSVLAKWGSPSVFRLLVMVTILSFVLNLLFDDWVLTKIVPGITNDALENARAAMFFLTPFRIFELAIGAALVFLRVCEVTDTRVGELCFLTGCGLIVYSAFSFTDKIAFPSYNAVAPCLGTALIIYANNPRISGILLRNRPAVWIGLRSYSLYLVHWPIIVFCRYWKLDTFTAGEQLVIGFVSLALATFMYRYVERPFRHRKSTEWTGNNDVGFVISCCTLACLLLLMAGNQWGNRGWIWRLDESKQAVFEKIADPVSFHKQYYGGVPCKKFTRCVINNGRPQNIYFVGDSHMRHYAAGFRASFPELQFTFLSNHCRFNTLALCYAGRWQDSPYVSKKADDFEFLRNSSDKVVIGQAWWGNRTYYDPRTGSEVRFSDRDVYIDFLIKHLREVNQYLGPDRIVVIGEVNRFGRYGSPLTCLGKPFTDSRCEYSPKSWALAFNRKMGKKLAEVGISFIDPTAKLCNQKGCLNLFKGMPLYSDRSHLSVWGSELIVARNRQEFAKAFAIDSHMTTDNNSR